MFQFTGFPPHALCVQAWVVGRYSNGVSPFGHPRITALVQLLWAFRRLRVLHRQHVPRHSPHTLLSLDKLSALTSARYIPRADRYATFKELIRRPQPEGQRQGEMIPGRATPVKVPRGLLGKTGAFPWSLVPSPSGFHVRFSRVVSSNVAKPASVRSARAVFAAFFARSGGIAART